MRARWPSLREWMAFLACLGLIAYFAHHAVHGRHGLEARAERAKQAHALERELEALRAEKARLERDVHLMNEGAAQDPDLLEEQARRLLNYAAPDEIILISPPRP